MRHRSWKLLNGIVLVFPLWLASQPTYSFEAASEVNYSSAQKDVCESCDGVLTGDWGGQRRHMSAGGIDVALANTGDYLVSRGGVRDDNAYSNLFELGIDFDLEKLINLRGGTAHLMVLGTHGDDMGEATGSIHAPSNLAVDDAIRLFEAWYQQDLASERASLLIGLYPVDSEFDAKVTSDVFINGGFGTGLDLSETGRNGPSIFPVSSFGARVAFSVSDRVTARMAMVDGVPGDPDDATSSRIRLSGEDGLFAIGEIDYSHGEFANFSRFAVGGWHYTTDFDDLREVDSDGNPVRRSGSSGVYAFLEGTLIAESGAESQGLQGFVRVGVADENVNQIGTYYGAGLVYTGLIPGRDDDVLGIGISVGVNGEKFVQAQEDALAPVARSETVYELTYRVQYRSWLTIQPVIQYHLHPGTDPAAENVSVFGLRVSAAL